MAERRLTEIEIMAYGQDVNDMRTELDAVLRDVEGVSLVVRQPTSRFRAIEPSVLVAVIAGASGAIAALIAGLLKMSRSKASKRIVIQCKTGTKIDVPADASSEKIREVVHLIQELDGPRITM